MKKELAEGSIFNFYQQLIQLRKEMPLIAEGSYKGYAKDHQAVYAYIREWQGQKLLCLNNFYKEEAEIEIPEEFLSGKVLVDNYEETKIEASQILKAYQTLAILI